MDGRDSYEGHSYQPSARAATILTSQKPGLPSTTVVVAAKRDWIRWVSAIHERALAPLGLIFEKYMQACSLALNPASEILLVSLVAPREASRSDKCLDCCKKLLTVPDDGGGCRGRLEK